MTPDDFAMITLNWAGSIPPSSFVGATSADPKKIRLAFEGPGRTPTLQRGT